jgi:hypothetical protein
VKATSPPYPTIPRPYSPIVSALLFLMPKLMPRIRPGGRAVAIGQRRRSGPAVTGGSSATGRRGEGPWTGPGPEAQLRSPWDGDGPEADGRAGAESRELAATMRSAIEIAADPRL